MNEQLLRGLTWGFLISGMLVVAADNSQKGVIYVVVTLLFLSAVCKTPEWLTGDIELSHRILGLGLALPVFLLSRNTYDTAIAVELSFATLIAAPMMLRFVTKAILR